MTRMVKTYTALVMACCLLCTSLSATLAVEETSVSMDEMTGGVLLEATTLQPVLEKDAQTARSVAGLCKLPALLVVCEAMDEGAIKPTDEVTVSERAARISGPTAFIETGETIAASELIKAAVMINAGDAIMALGEAIYGSETAFLEQIHSRLKDMDIPLTLSDAVGKDLQVDPMTLAKLGAELVKSETFSQYCMLTLDGITHTGDRYTELVNPNRMIKTYAGCTGVSTGSSQADGYCGVFSVTRGDTSLICVVLGAKNSNSRFEIAKQMLDSAFATIKTQRVATAGEVMVKNVPVQGGKRREVNLVAKDDVVIILEKAQADLKGVPEIPEVLIAPFDVTDVQGTIVYKTDAGETLARVELVPQQAVEIANLRDIIREIFLGYLRA